MSKNPWKTLSSRTVYENDWMRVREDQVIRPDGNPGIYGVVDTRIATGVVALDSERRVYLVGQYRYPLDQYSWEIVEGGADKGEDPLEAAKRELQEEAGIVAQDWTQLGEELHLSNCISSEVGYVYLATDLAETTRSPEGTELLEIRRVSLRESINMVEQGEIKDVVSIVGLLRAERYLLGKT